MTECKHGVPLYWNCNACSDAKNPQAEEIFLKGGIMTQPVLPNLLSDQQLAQLHLKEKLTQHYLNLNKHYKQFNPFNCGGKFKKAGVPVEMICDVMERRFS